MENEIIKEFERVIDNKDLIVNIARFMHEEYENAARQYGWITQKTARCDFENLPESNQQTMLLVAYRVYKQFILTKLKEKDDEIKRLTLMFQTTTFDLSSAENKLKEEYQRGYNKGVFDHSARLEDVINEASEKARQEGYEVGFAQAESGLPKPMIEFIRKDERIKTLEEVRTELDSIINAHLWGDYGLSMQEVYDGCKTYLKKIRNLINNLKN